jgi:hypothetical protein
MCISWSSRNGNGKSSGPGQGPVITSRTTKRTNLYFALPVNAYPCRRGEDDAKTSEGARGRSSCCAHLVHVPVRSDLVFPAAAALCARQVVCVCVCLSILTLNFVRVSQPLISFFLEWLFDFSGLCHRQGGR